MIRSFSARNLKGRALKQPNGSKVLQIATASELRSYIRGDRKVLHLVNLCNCGTRTYPLP